MSISFNNSHYFGSEMDDMYFSNDYSKTNDVYLKLNSMLDNNSEVGGVNSLNEKNFKDATVADILGIGNRSNYSVGSNSNMLDLSSLNIPNGNVPNNFAYNTGSNMTYSPGQNNPLNKFPELKAYNVGPINPLNKLISQNWAPQQAQCGRAIRAASPQMSFSSDSSGREHPFLSGFERIRDNRSSSPTESDTSGISSVSELSSISDLMNNLNLGTAVGSVSRVPSFDTPNNLNCHTDLPIVSSPFCFDRRWSVNSVMNANYGDLDSIERAARLYRNAAAFCEANSTWSGHLPARSHKNPTYSCKVFLGGVPWDITEAGLVEAFAPFGQIKIVWPGKDSRSASYPPKAGYVYIIFEAEKQVKALLQACTHDYSNGGNWYFKISSRRMRSKDVQVIPWAIGDSNFVHCPSQRLDPSKTVFVGALHGMLTAEGLAVIMNDLFGGVVYAGIDTDKNKYPIGSGRITFNNHKSYMKAVTTAFIDIKTPRFNKKVLPESSDTLDDGTSLSQEIDDYYQECAIPGEHPDDQEDYSLPVTQICPPPGFNMPQSTSINSQYHPSSPRCFDDMENDHLCQPPGLSTELPKYHSYSSQDCLPRVVLAHHPFSSSTEKHEICNSSPQYYQNVPHSQISLQFYINNF